MTKKILLFFLSTVVWSINAQIKIPQNTLEKKRISNWIVARTPEITEENRFEIIKNVNSYYQDQDANNIKVLKLSKLNDVSIALYQLFDTISFKSNFLISSIINSETDHNCDFVFNHGRFDYLECLLKLGKPIIHYQLDK